MYTSFIFSLICLKLRILSRSGYSRWERWGTSLVALWWILSWVSMSFWRLGCDVIFKLQIWGEDSTKIPLNFDWDKGWARVWEGCSCIDSGYYSILQLFSWYSRLSFSFFQNEEVLNLCLKLLSRDYKIAVCLLFVFLANDNVYSTQNACVDKFMLHM